MLFISSRPDDRLFELLARSDYIVQKLRSRLPPSSLWHEKIASRAQLESIAIVSAGGLYDINTFDRRSPDFIAQPEMLMFTDLGVTVYHVPDSNETLSMARVDHLIHEANDEFDLLLASDRRSTVSVVRRLTVTIRFSLREGDADEFIQECFTDIARSLNLELTYVPYIFRECWLPTSFFYNAIRSTDYDGSAAEFVLPTPETFDAVASLITSSFSASGTLRVPGIHARFPNREQPFQIHFVGRAH